MLLRTRPWFPEVMHGGKQRERVCCDHLVNRGHPRLTARQGDPDNFRIVRIRHHRRAQVTPRQRVRNGVREEVVPHPVVSKHDALFLNRPFKPRHLPRPHDLPQLVGRVGLLSHPLDDIGE